ncbi:uncharacterized protein STAUR_2236 [Stigmatella aurantiaca DW4/3-1]|uniref:Uncharacterized protein n=1 Tax=Stigmatella aurantiaca (strain DW4/3-1) TaxID=378806 RepID=E3FCB7_STIAD|nr:uncharacterized protein STAUR_2236 [Stigmatella aurantiaca DW4/3-1]
MERHPCQRPSPLGADHRGLPLPLQDGARALPHEVCPRWQGDRPRVHAGRNVHGRQGPNGQRLGERPERPLPGAISPRALCAIHPHPLHRGRAGLSGRGGGGCATGGQPKQHEEQEARAHGVGHFIPDRASAIRPDVEVIETTKEFLSNRSQSLSIAKPD